MYLVKNISGTVVTMPKRKETVSHDVGNWGIGDSDYVDDDVIDLYRAHTSVFTITGKNGASVPPAVVTTGLAVVAGLTAADTCADGFVHQTTFTFAAMALAVTDALAYASELIYTFPAGRIDILGATGTLQWAVTTDRASTINDSASLTWSLGSAAASNITLSSTMVNELPLATKALAAATTALNTASTNALAASAQLDGTTTPVPVYLNAAFATNTDIDADGTLTATGTITISWVNLGDF